MTTTVVPMRKKEMVSSMESYMSDMNRPGKKTTNPNQETKQRLALIKSGPIPIDKFKAKGAVQEGMQEGGQQMQRTTGNTTPSPLIQALMQKVESDRLNAIPFKNSSINVFDQKRYDMSMEDMATPQDKNINQ